MNQKMVEKSEAATPSHPMVRRILVVDDEPAILFAYRRLMTREGIEVDVCENLDSAMRLITTSSYVAVIADLRLSGTDSMDGLELIRRLRNVQPEAKVILATGYGNREIEETADALGAIYFEKPVVPTTILAELTKIAG